MTEKDKDKEKLLKAALEYHEFPRPGKIEVAPIKPLSTQRDLALAYSPGVAAASEAIAANPADARRYTSRGNLVAVITNGTAVLGLGDIGPLAAKPVMEGKGVLFKKFAGIDVFDIEINEHDPDKLIDIIASLEPTFGGINLEDIKAPECFHIEQTLKKRMNIPVFHDDQHGTAIISGAAMLNALDVVGKKIDEVKVVASGAGAAALSCLNLWVRLGVKLENITVCDRHGVIHEGREVDMEPNKARFARQTGLRTMAEALNGADIFLGLSAAGVLKPDMIKPMARDPVIFALANPTPEIMPEEAKEARPDAIIATGRSDYPNQVNNVLCFPFLFRGALDVGATGINEDMKLACVKALAALARAETSDVVAKAYGEEEYAFGPEYLIPKPFDPRLITTVAAAVAQAAMESGAATRPIKDFDAYHDQLSQFVFNSMIVMRPVFDAAKKAPKRVVLAEGEEDRVLRAAQTIVDEGLARPILIGRPDVILHRIEKDGLRIRPYEDFDLVNQDSDPRYKEYWSLYHQLMERKGVTPDYARKVVRTRTTLIGALMLQRGEADAMVCGTIGLHQRHLRHTMNVLGLREGVKKAAAMNGLMLPNIGTVFIADTYVNPDPTAEEIAEIAFLAAEEVQRFGITPKVALLSHSNFGAIDTASSHKMREALQLILARNPRFEVEGEMHGDAALSEEIRSHLFPNSRLKGAANLLIMPNLDAANIAFNLLKMMADNTTIGPILMGMAKPVHILTPTATVRRIVNITALASVDAQAKR